MFFQKESSQDLQDFKLLQWKGSISLFDEAIRKNSFLPAFAFGQLRMTVSSCLLNCVFKQFYYLNFIGCPLNLKNIQHKRLEKL